MNRDTELFRKIIGWVIENQKSCEPIIVELPGYDRDTIDYNIKLLADKDYAKILEFPDVRIIRITSKGHDFVESHSG